MPIEPSYIHFLDSDDYLELDCIEECVQYSLKNDLDLVLYSGNDFVKDSFKQEEIKLNENHILRYFKNLEEYRIYSGIELLSNHLQGDYLAFSWGCQIKMKLLNDIRFFEGIMAEDALFAPILIINASRIGILKKKYYKRLIRPFSITDFGDAHTQKTLPLFLGDIYKEIPDNKSAKNYFLAYSCACICSELYSYFILSKKYDEKVVSSVDRLIKNRIPMAFYSLHFESDPRNARKRLHILKVYLKNIGWGSKLAYCFPHIFKIAKRIKNKKYKVVEIR